MLRAGSLIFLRTLQSYPGIMLLQKKTDIASRGCDPNQLLDCRLWRRGPSFIHKPISTWSLQPFTEICIAELPEINDQTVPTLVTINTCTNDLYEVIKRFSSFSKMQRVFAYIIRFVNCCRARGSVHNLEKLTSKDLSDAVSLCVRVTQQICFPDVLKELRSGKALRSSLRLLSPFLDEEGLLRVGGRLKNSELNASSKHPLLLPKVCHLSNLVCDHYHVVSLHSGPRVVQALIQRRFWVISLRGLLRKRIKSCLSCFKFTNRPSQPLMADLPACRVRVGRAFNQVGTDFAGPFSIKESTRRSSSISKSYLCVFVCMATKAVHLEAVSGLSTKAFLDAFDRFVSRRGLPMRRWSTQYLHTLMQRNKWTRATPNIQLDDVVFIQGVRTSPLSWPVGRVADVHPGADGTVRVVTVRTTGGSYVRPVNKLVVLPAPQ